MEKFVRDRTPRVKAPAAPTLGTIDEKWAAGVRIPPRVVVIFTRQMASMLENAVPVSQALDTLSNQADNPLFGEVIRQVGEKLESGVPLSRCLSYFPKVFPTIFLTMVQIGEQTGTLDDALDKLSVWLERDDALRQRLKSALTYPAFVFTLAVLMTLGLFYTIMPGFIAIFEDMKIELPLITKIIVAITNGLRHPGAVLFGISLLLFLLKAFRLWIGTEAGMSQFYRICLRVPLLGGMLTYGSLARYCAAMEALLTTGMDMTRALKLAAAASGNPLVQGDAQTLVDSVVAGNPVGEHMRMRDDVYPPTLTNLITSGEESSRLPEMFGRTAVYYDMEMSYKVEALGAALEPIMLFGVATVVGTIVLSIFIPMYAYVGKLGE